MSMTKKEIRLKHAVEAHRPSEKTVNEHIEEFYARKADEGTTHLMELCRTMDSQRCPKVGGYTNVCPGYKTCSMITNQGTEFPQDWRKNDSNR